MSGCTKARSFVLLFAVIFTSGCGTTSNLKAPQSSELPNLTRYSTVVVLDFENKTTRKFKDEQKRAAFEEEVRMAGRNFADRIAAEISKTGAYSQVERVPSEEESVVISGDITRYTEGNAAARLFIGLGAGSSYFDSRVMVSDNLSKQEIGEVLVDKNSWFLGGGLAATQSVESYMQGAAEKIAKQMALAKRTSPY